MIHIVTAFSRAEYVDFYIENLRKVPNITWHVIGTKEELLKVDEKLKEPWIEPFLFIPGSLSGGWLSAKLNMFMVSAEINDNEFYFFLNDDDWLDTTIFSKIEQMTDNVIFVSMKRGHHDLGGHPTVTLFASPDMHVGTIGLEQYFLKGRIMKQVRFRTDNYPASDYPPHRQGSPDGHMAETLMKLFPIRYEPNFYIYFNYLEPGRWNK